MFDSALLQLILFWFLGWCSLHQKFIGWSLLETFNVIKINELIASAPSSSSSTSCRHCFKLSWEVFVCFRRGLKNTRRRPPSERKLNFKRKMLPETLGPIFFCLKLSSSSRLWRFELFSDSIQSRFRRMTKKICIRKKQWWSNKLKIEMEERISLSAGKIC